MCLPTSRSPTCLSSCLHISSHNVPNNSVTTNMLHTQSHHTVPMAYTAYTVPQLTCMYPTPHSTHCYIPGYNLVQSFMYAFYSYSTGVRHMHVVLQTSPSDTVITNMHQLQEPQLAENRSSMHQHLHHAAQCSKALEPKTHSAIPVHGQWHTMIQVH